MEQHAGIDVSLKLSSVCIVDASGKIVKEAKVASEPEALRRYRRGVRGGREAKLWRGEETAPRPHAGLH
jgi:hypothetical protein